MDNSFASAFFAAFIAAFTPAFASALASAMAASGAPTISSSSIGVAPLLDDSTSSTLQSSNIFVSGSSTLSRNKSLPPLKTLSLDDTLEVSSYEVEQVPTKRALSSSILPSHTKRSSLSSNPPPAKRRFPVGDKAVHEAALAHLAWTVDRRDEAEANLKAFLNLHSMVAIYADPDLRIRYETLNQIKTDAWKAYFLAKNAACPKTIEDLLWILASAGFTHEVKPFMNLSQATRNCDYLKAIMKNVKGWGALEETQLHCCIRLGSIASVERLLLIKNIDVTIKDVDGVTPLHLLVKSSICMIDKQFLELVHTLIKKGADVNAKTNDGDAPLHNAYSCKAKVIRLLIENGADVNASGKYGKRPLYMAALLGRFENVILLIEKGADVNARDNLGKTLLHAAKSVEIMQFLLDNSALTVDVRDNTGYTPLHSNISSIKMARFLIGKGADVNARCDLGDTPLLIASMLGNIEILHLLIENGADIEARNMVGWKVLHNASLGGNLHIVKELVTRYHVDINAKDVLMKTAVGNARRENHPDVVAFLQANGGIDDGLPIDQ
jgi:ankyrin repeat protein